MKKTLLVILLLLGVSTASYSQKETLRTLTPEKYAEVLTMIFQKQLGLDYATEQKVYTTILETIQTSQPYATDKTFNGYTAWPIIHTSVDKKMRDLLTDAQYAKYLSFMNSPQDKE